ncbi:trigger factor [Microseira sp. BLCC-F43]|jgi:trigger factor|uniref:trigger factor n=1 Tax=Microseira sp. BLCC-F43 TaxID=3153602 RepID=UPI0035B827E0
MKVTQEKLPKSQIGLEIEITPEMSKKAYDQVFQDLTRNANIPGFRKGKVPRQVLLQRFGAIRLKATALEELIQDGVKQALKQEAIAAIGNYQLRSNFEELVGQYEPGKPLTFSAAVDVQPEVQLSDYTGWNLKVEEGKYDQASVDKFLEERRKEQATLVPVEGRPAQMGDIAVVDFTGRLVTEGEEESSSPPEIPGGSATDFQVELAEGRFIGGFVDGIVGMTPGETKEIAVTFPETYAEKSLEGKPAIFTITLKEIKEKELPELNDDFAQEISDMQTLEELRANLETRFKEQAEKRTATNKEQAILDELVKHVEVDLPATLLEQEIDAMLTQTAMQMSNQGFDIKKLFTQETIPQLRDRSRPEAIERIKRTMALGEVAKRESISVEPAAVEAKVKELIEQYQERDIDPERLRAYVEEDLLKEKIVKWLEEHSTLELVPEGSLSASESETTSEESAANPPAEETPTPETETEAAVGE